MINKQIIKGMRLPSLAALTVHYWISARRSYIQDM
jgi:hypothetical protein